MCQLLRCPAVSQPEPARFRNGDIPAPAVTAWPVLAEHPPGPSGQARRAAPGRLSRMVTIPGRVTSGPLQSVANWLDPCQELAVAFRCFVATCLLNACAVRDAPSIGESSLKFVRYTFVPLSGTICRRRWQLATAAAKAGEKRPSAMSGGSDRVPYSCRSFSRSCRPARSAPPCRWI